MKKCTKRILSAVLLCAMLFISAPIARADAPENYLSQDNLYMHLHEMIYLETQRQDSDFYNLDTSLIAFGDPMAVYSYKQGAIEPAEAIYIPVFYDGILKTVAYMTYSQGSLIGGELSAQLVPVLEDCTNCAVSVIYDSQDIYLKIGEEIMLVQSDFPQTPSLANTAPLTANHSLCALEQAAGASNLSSAELSAIYPFDSFARQYHEKPIPQRSPSAAAVYPASYQLPFQMILQNGHPICRAAAAASIGLQQTGDYYTAEYIAKYMTGGLNGGDTLTALMALQSIFGLNGIDLYYAPYFSQIKSAVYDEGNPVYARIYGNAGEGICHAIVVYGYTDFEINTYDGLLIVGDGNFSSSRTVYFVTDRVFPYTLNGNTGYIDQFIWLY